MGGLIRMPGIKSVLPGGDLQTNRSLFSGNGADMRTSPSWGRDLVRKPRLIAETVLTSSMGNKSTPGFLDKVRRKYLNCQPIYYSFLLKALPTTFAQRHSPLFQEVYDPLFPYKVCGSVSR